MAAVEDEIAQAYAAHGESLDLLAAVDRILVSGDVSEARGAFERAGARDFLGLEIDAIPLYREALDKGLTEPERLRCLVQLGSSLRNVGDTEDAVRVLRTARGEARADQEEWVDAFLALALSSHGQPSQALSVALGALAPHLTQYGPAVSRYAEELSQRGAR
ncbi:MAG: tetratricopeptide repeat protein [Herbiconiux sp.]|nr:tetratricopeptide repeat protein [Herbiconiux sp.]